MSHFGVLVLAEESLDRQAAEGYVASVLERYDENREVEEHERECYCVGWNARLEARKGLGPEWEEEATQRRAAFRDLQLAVVEAGKGEIEEPFFSSGVDDLPEGPKKRELKALDERLTKEWKEFCDRREAAEKKLEKAHHEYGKPDPTCEECGGTGREVTTSNPEGYWDWWVIGGRWTGCISDYDPCMDERNFGPCKFCNQTGKRYWLTETVATAPSGGLGSLMYHQNEAGLWERKVPCEQSSPGAEEAECNGCNGTGIERAWNNAPHDSDVLPLSEAKDPVGHFYAIVTPDGEWHQKGKMGWWGMSDDKISDEDWRAYIDSLLDTYHDATAIVVDCHV